MEKYSDHAERISFQTTIRSRLDAILFESTCLNRRSISKGSEKAGRYYTYKSLVLHLKLKLKQNEII